MMLRLTRLNGQLIAIESSAIIAVYDDGGDPHVMSTVQLSNRAGSEKIYVMETAGQVMQMIFKQTPEPPPATCPESCFPTTSALESMILWFELCGEASVKWHSAIGSGTVIQNVKLTDAKRQLAEYREMFKNHIDCLEVANKHGWLQAQQTMPEFFDSVCRELAKWLANCSYGVRKSITERISERKKKK